MRTSVLRLGAGGYWGQGTGLLLLSWVTLGKSPYCSDARRPCLKNGGVDNADSLEGLWENDQIILLTKGIGTLASHTGVQ